MQLLSSLSSVLKTCATILWRLWLWFPACIRRAVYDYIMERRISRIVFQDFEEDIDDSLPFGLRLRYYSAVPPEIEASNLKFVRENTTIPGIPDVLDVVPVTSDGLSMGVVLTKEPKLEGVVTLHDWLRTRTMYPPEYYHYISLIFGPPHLRGKRSCAELSDLALSFDKPFLDLSDSPQLIEDLRKALTELRSIVPPSLYRVSGASDSPLLYKRYGEQRVLQPFSNVCSFHGTIETILSEVAREDRGYFNAPMRIMKQHRLCFSHSNLTRENILVTSDGRLATIINWETAGWFPEYWDYALVDKPMSLAEARVLNQFWTAVGVFGEGHYDENPELYSYDSD